MTTKSELAAQKCADLANERAWKGGFSSASPSAQYWSNHMTDTTDLEARLRDEGGRNGGQGAYAWKARELCIKAADTIASLREEVARLKADLAKAREALTALQDAERRYRQEHDLHGDGSTKAGRAWDVMRRKGDIARAALKEIDHG